ncbi:MAG TPA: hypothetical protein PLY87_30140, partial [Planctomycetaceae bacterium]|nr:hypothetical protein [Planctomycetaceae bacterium]
TKSAWTPIILIDKNLKIPPFTSDWTDHTPFEDTYKLRMKMSAGEISSTVIAGFMIPIQAVFDAEANRLALAELMQSR